MMSFSSLLGEKYVRREKSMNLRLWFTSIAIADTTRGYR
jgi:hypothetical protein